MIYLFVYKVSTSPTTSIYFLLSSTRFHISSVSHSYTLDAIRLTGVLFQLKAGHNSGSTVASRKLSEAN